MSRMPRLSNIPTPWKPWTTKRGDEELGVVWCQCYHHTLSYWIDEPYRQIEVGVWRIGSGQSKWEGIKSLWRLLGNQGLHSDHLILDYRGAMQLATDWMFVVSRHTCSKLAALNAEVQSEIARPATATTSLTSVLCYGKLLQFLLRDDPRPKMQVAKRELVAAYICALNRDSFGYVQHRESAYNSEGANEIESVLLDKIGAIPSEAIQLRQVYNYLQTRSNEEYPLLLEIIDTMFWDPEHFAASDLHTEENTELLNWLEELINVMHMECRMHHMHRLKGEGTGLETARGWGVDNAMQGYVI